MDLNVDIDPRGAERVLRLLSSRLHDGRGRFLGLVDRLLVFEQARFAGQNRWRPLAASTVRQHRAAGRDQRPLVLTGKLMASLTRRGATGQIVEVRRETLRFGTRLFEARFQQKGTAYPSAGRHHASVGEGRSGLRVPRRTIVGATREQRRELVGRWRELLLDGVA